MVVIRQITSKVVCGEHCVGKWYCSDSAMGTDKHTVHRYLKKDGTWGQTADYFDTKAEIEDLLSRAKLADFTMNRQELHDRADIRDMTEQAMNESDTDVYRDFGYEEPDYFY